METGRWQNEILDEVFADVVKDADYFAWVTGGMSWDPKKWLWNITELNKFLDSNAETSRKARFIKALDELKVPLERDDQNNAVDLQVDDRERLRRVTRGRHGE